MLNINDEQLKTKIAEAIKNRDDLVADANSKIAYLNGKIAALKELLEPEEAEHVEPDTEV